MKKTKKRNKALVLLCTRALLFYGMLANYIFDTTKDVNLELFEKQFDFDMFNITSTSSSASANGRDLRPIRGKADIIEITTTDPEAKLAFFSMCSGKLFNQVVIPLPPGTYRILGCALSQCFFIEHDQYPGEKIVRYSLKPKYKQHVSLWETVRQFKISTTVGKSKYIYADALIQKLELENGSEQEPEEQRVRDIPKKFIKNMNELTRLGVFKYE